LKGLADTQANTETMDCSICLDAIGNSYTQLSCSHQFHLKCIVNWLSKKDSCPCCRGATVETETIERTPEDDNGFKTMLLQTIEVLSKEKSRLETLVIKKLEGDQRRWYYFSKRLQVAYPEMFRNFLYSDAGEGEELRFNAFLHDRLRVAEDASLDTKYFGLYSRFTRKYNAWAATI
jgi:hypothetical protein